MSKKESVIAGSIGPLPHPKLWQRMINLNAARENAKSKEGDKVRERKGLEQELDKAGAKGTPEAKDLAWKHYRVCSMIDTLRNDQKLFADRLGKTLMFATQGNLNDAAVDHFLEHADEEPEEEHEQDKGAVLYKGDGRPRDGEPVAPAKRGGSDRPAGTPLDADVITVVSQNPASALYQAGMRTLRNVIARLVHVGYIAVNGGEEFDPDQNEDAIESVAAEARVSVEQIEKLVEAIEKHYADENQAADKAQELAAELEAKRKAEAAATTPAASTPAPPFVSKPTPTTRLSQLLTPESAQACQDHGLITVHDVQLFITERNGDAVGLNTLLNLDLPTAATLAKVAGAAMPAGWDKFVAAEPAPAAKPGRKNKPEKPATSAAPTKPAKPEKPAPKPRKPKAKA